MLVYLSIVLFDQVVDLLLYFTDFLCGGCFFFLGFESVLRHGGRLSYYFTLLLALFILNFRFD